MFYERRGEMSSSVLHRGPCPSCPSSDAFTFYDDGHGYCFSCQYWTKTSDEAAGEERGLVDSISRGRRDKNRLSIITGGAVGPIKSRGLTKKTCEKWGYQKGKFNGQPVQIANYRSHQGQVVAQKVRFPDKEFIITGNPKDMLLYGQWFPVSSWRRIIITEGEIDAMSVDQAQGNKWPVVSVPNGAQGARRELKKAVEWLEKFDEIVLMFDMDEPGRKATEECAILFSPGKVKIAELPLKDPNEMLKAGREEELIKAIWNAKPYRPDGIVPGTELLDSILNPKNMDGVDYPWGCLNVYTKGLRKQELVTLTAGSGIGKSTACREIAYKLVQEGHRIGYIALEESVQRSALGIIGIHLNKILHLGLDGVDKKKLKQAYAEIIGNGRVYFYDHFGSTDSENLLGKIRFLARGFDCDFIFLDHLSIIVSGISDGDERRIIDNTMTSLRSLVQELNIGMVLVSHLKDPEGNKGHEEGAQVTLRQLRGSRAIGQLSDVVIGLERNQQDEKLHNIVTVRVVKNRPIGKCGVAGYLVYDEETGRLFETTSDGKNPFSGDSQDNSGEEDF